MRIKEIWRYPVKTMAGEKLQRVAMGPLGIEGDRAVRVENARGQVVTSRSHPRLLGHRGSLGANGVLAGRPARYHRSCGDTQAGAVTSAAIDHFPFFQVGDASSPTTMSP